MTKPCLFSLDKNTIHKIEKFGKKKGWSKSGTVRVAIDFLYQNQFPSVSVVKLKIGRPKKGHI